MITVELFCGTKSFSKVAKELGHKTFTVDIDPKLEPDLVCDIMDFKVEMLPEEFRRPAFYSDWSYSIDRKGGSALARGVIPPDLFKEIFKDIGGIDDWKK